MFDSHFRTLFLSTPAKLNFKDKRLIISLKNELDNGGETTSYPLNGSLNKDIKYKAKSPHQILESKATISHKIKFNPSLKALNNVPHRYTKNTNQEAKNTYCDTYKDEIAIPLSDILCLIIESRQVSLSSYLLNELAKEKVLVFVCDEFHLPSGIFTPFLGHYRSLSILQNQINLSKQKKAILWQKIIKQKILNQANLLEFIKIKKASELHSLAKSVHLGDSSNNEAKAAAIYFPALFQSIANIKGFSRKISGSKIWHTDKISPKKQTDFESQIPNIHTDSPDNINHLKSFNFDDIKSLQNINLQDEQIAVINAALNYGYAIVRGMVVRAICASGLNPALGIFHSNQFNPFNLADDLMEPYRIFVDSLVAQMLENKELQESFSISNRAKLAEILSASVLLSEEQKIYPLHRAIIKGVQSLSRSMSADVELVLPVFEGEKSNGREIYESASDV